MNNKISCRRNFENIEDLALGKRHSVRKFPAFETAPGPRYPKLVAGTERYNVDWVVRMHNSDQIWPSCDISCYSISDITIAGWGNILLEGGILTDPRIMPIYVRQYLKLPESSNALASHYGVLQFREIEDPCVVLAGHGPGVYGHFLIEMLFRILVSNSIQEKLPFSVKFLLDASTPGWLLKILKEYLSIDLDRIVFYDPNFECVHLAQAVLPARVLRDKFFHNSAARMIYDLKSCLPASNMRTHRRIFVVRGGYVNPQTPFRILKNEDELSDLAEKEFGVVPVRPELYAWHDQVAIFDHARFVVGQAGSILHNAIFSNAGAVIASIGWMNSVQSEIGALLSHQMAYLTKDIELTGEFYIDPGDFRSFLSTALRSVSYNTEDEVYTNEIMSQDPSHKLSVTSVISAGAAADSDGRLTNSKGHLLSIWKNFFSKQ